MLDDIRYRYNIQHNQYFVFCTSYLIKKQYSVLCIPKGFKLLERAPGVSVEHIIAATAAELIIEGEILEMNFAQ